MSPERPHGRKLAVGVVLAALASASPASAARPERFAFDQAPRAEAGAPSGAADLRDRLGRFGVVAGDPGSGGPRVIARLDGYLTPPTAGKGADVALDYLRDNRRGLGLDDADIDALRLVRETPSPGGRRQILWQQTYRGIPSIDSQVRANLALSNRLANIVGPVIPDLSVETTTPRVTAAEAYAATRRGAGASAGAAVQDTGGGPTRPTTFSDGSKASLVIYRAGSAQRLAWRVLARTSSTELYDAVVDAGTGAVVRRVNRVVFASSASVFENFPGAATGGTQTTKDITGYLDPGATTLTGDNAHAFSDVGDRVPGTTDPPVLTPLPADEVGPSAGTDWLYPFTPFAYAPGNCDPPGCAWNHLTAGSWTTNRAQDVTQLFWLVNNFHDHLKAPPIGFDEASGNFEQDNGAAGGVGGDAILAQAMDGANKASGLPDADHVDNANMSTLADGSPGLMQMYLFKPPDFGAYSGADEADIVYHEYTHGLSNRLVTDATGAGALDLPQPGAMGEAWSDFYALDYLVDQGLRADDPATPGEVKVGDYIDHGDDLIRTEALDCEPGSPASACPGTSGAGPGGYTYGDFGRIIGEPEVHADGEIWGQTLWQLRKALIAAHPTDGVERAERYVTDAMRLSPPEPSYLDMRNAILEASTDDDGVIWTVFASRGMGYFASTESGYDVRPVEDFSPPPPPAGPTGAVQGRIDDDTGTPQSAIKVAFGGHDTGLGPELSASTNASGDYTISNVPTGTYPLLRASGTGALADAQRTDIAVGTGTTTTVGLRLKRDFASAAGGAAVPLFTGPAFLGCGPAQTIDDDVGTTWSTTRPVPPTPPRELTIDLGTPIDIDAIRIDPTGGCGDDPGASLKDYEVQASDSPTTGFATIASGSFGAADRNRYDDIALSGNLAGRRFVKLIAKTPQSNSGSGAQFIDVTEIQVFRAAATVATTLGVTGLSQTGATLTGTIDPKGAATSYQFEFGGSPSYGSVSPASPADVGDGFGPVAVSTPITGLTPGATYHYRVVAVRGSTRIPGVDQSFTTTASPQPPAVTTGSATSVSPTAATLNGTLSTKGQPTTFHFDVGTSTTYGAQTPDAFSDDGAVSAAVGGLSPGVPYHYRLVAANANGTTFGSDRTFTTTAAQPPFVPPPMPTPPSPSTDIGLTLSSARSIAVGARRRLRARIKFGKGISMARGRLEAIAGRTVLGRVTVTPRPGGTVKVTLALTSDGAGRLARAGRLKATLRATFKTAAGKPRVATRTVTLTGRRTR